MKSKIFLLLCFMLIIVSIAGVSASEDINQASSITNVVINDAPIICTTVATPKPIRAPLSVRFFL